MYTVYDTKRFVIIVVHVLCLTRICYRSIIKCISLLVSAYGVGLYLPFRLNGLSQGIGLSSTVTTYTWRMVFLCISVSTDSST